MVAVIVAAARAPGLPRPTEDALRRLEGSGVEELEALADGILAGVLADDQLSRAPFVGRGPPGLARVARGAARSGRDGARRAERVRRAPGRRSRASSRRRTGSATCSCALCAAEWNVPRVRCVACGDDAGLEYLHVEGDAGAKAEACASCGVYVKLFDEERRPGVEAAADDAATLALDLLVAKEGYARAGPNLYVAAQAGWLGYPQSRNRSGTSSSPAFTAYRSKSVTPSRGGPPRR